MSKAEQIKTLKSDIEALEESIPMFENEPETQAPMKLALEKAKEELAALESGKEEKEEKEEKDSTKKKDEPASVKKTHEELRADINIMEEAVNNPDTPDEEKQTYKKAIKAAKDELGEEEEEIEEEETTGADGNKEKKSKGKQAPKPEPKPKKKSPIDDCKEVIKKYKEKNKDKTPHKKTMLLTTLINAEKAQFKKVATKLHESHHEEKIAKALTIAYTSIAGYKKLLTGSESNLGTFKTELEEIKESLTKKDGKVGKPAKKGKKKKMGKGGKISIDSNYVDLKETPNGLKIILTESGKEELEDVSDDENLEYKFDDFFDSIRGNSELLYFPNLGDAGLGMTDAPGIVDGYYYDDNGDLQEYDDSKIFYFTDYAIKDFVRELKENGEVEFIKHQ